MTDTQRQNLGAEDLTITPQHIQCWTNFRDLFFARTDKLGRRLPEVLGDNDKPITGPWRYYNFTCKTMAYQPINLGIIAAHLEGTLTTDAWDDASCPNIQIQTYMVDEKGTSVATAIDLDVKGENHADADEHYDTRELALVAAQKLIAATEALGLKAHLEITKSAGYRVWIFHNCCPWSQAHDLGTLLLQRAGLHPKIEVFPKSAPTGKDSVGSAVFVPCWGVNARKGRQIMIDPATEHPREVEEFVADALAHRTTPERLAEIVTLAAEAGEIKATPPKRERSERTGEDGDSPLAETAEIADACWKAQLAGCEALREMAQRCVDGLQLSRTEWMRLATHLKQYGDWGLSEFHRLSSSDSRYMDYETDMMFDSIQYGPTTCPKMDCGRDPQSDCGMAEGKVSSSWFAYRGLKQLKMAAEEKSDEAVLNRNLAGVDLTDTGNAARLYARQGGLMRHSPAEKSWYIWQDGIWKRYAEDSPVPLQLSLDAMRKIKDEAFALRPKSAEDKVEGDDTSQDVQNGQSENECAESSDDPPTPDNKAAKENSDAKAQKDYEGLLKHAMRSQAEPRIKAALSLLRTVVDVRVDPDDFDAEPELVSVKNGTIDLRTGRLRPHDKEDMITKTMPVEFDDRAKCPHFERFMFEVVPDRETRAFLQKWMGYCLTGLTREQIFLYLYGSGKNGKSTLLNVIKMIMGSALHATITSSAVMDDPRGNKDMQRAMLPFVGARAVTITEVGEGARLDEELLKAVTGGDPLKVRRLYQEELEVVPIVKLTMAGNHKPKITGTDPGIWRRVQLVPFETVIQTVDKKLGEKLAAEKSGILNWMLTGLAAYYREGLETPPQVKAATDAYRADSDVLGQYLDERYAKDANGKTDGGVFYQNYSSWCFEYGYKAMANNTLATKMKERGFGKGGGRERRTWIGLRLRTAKDDANNETEVLPRKGSKPQTSAFPECMMGYEREQAENLRLAQADLTWE